MYSYFFFAIFLRVLIFRVFFFINMIGFFCFFTRMLNHFYHLLLIFFLFIYLLFYLFIFFTLWIFVFLCIYYFIYFIIRLYLTALPLRCVYLLKLHLLQNTFGVLLQSENWWGLSSRFSIQKFHELIYCGLCQWTGWNRNLFRELLLTKSVRPHDITESSWQRTINDTTKFDLYIIFFHCNVFKPHAAVMKIF